MKNDMDFFKKHSEMKMIVCIMVNVCLVNEFYSNKIKTKTRHFCCFTDRAICSVEYVFGGSFLTSQIECQKHRGYRGAEIYFY